jgi:hypothetical protein
MAVSPSPPEHDVAKRTAPLTFGPFVHTTRHLHAAARLAAFLKLPDARQAEAGRALREDLDASRAWEDA